MTGRRTRAPPSRDADSSHQPMEGVVTRQTRSAAKRAQAAPVLPDSKSPKNQPKLPQRGTRRRPRSKSTESIATNDFPKSSVEDVNMEHAETPEATNREEVAVTVEIQSESEEEVVAGNQSETDEESAAILLQDLLEFGLPRLSTWCEETYVALVASGKPESTAEDRKKLNLTKRLFQSARRTIAENGGPYIDLSASGLPFAKYPDAHAKVQRVALLANLISLLLSLSDVRNSKKELRDFLRELDDASHLLLGHNHPSRSDISYLGFRVRCGRLVEALHSDSDADPLVLATTIFCEKPSDTPEEAVLRLREGPFRELGKGEQDKDLFPLERFGEKIEEIIKKLSNPARSEAEEALRLLYPQDALLEGLHDWAQSIYDSLIKEAQDIAEERGDKDGDTIQVIAEEGSVSGSEYVAGGEDEEMVEEVGSEAGTDLSSEEGEYDHLGPVGAEHNFIPDPAFLAAARQREIEVLRNQPVEPQTTSQTRDAIRQLRPSQILGSLGPNPAAGNSGRDTYSITARKRTRPEGEDEDGQQRKQIQGQQQDQEQEAEEGVQEGQDDDDDGFQANQQVLNEARRIQRGRPIMSKPAARRRTRVEAFTRTRISPAHPPSSSEARENNELQVLSQATSASGMVERPKPRKPQMREKWTEDETNTLLDMIADYNAYGYSWAVMERAQEDDNPVFRVYRNQQAIRDRARNLKKWYLCRDAVLPAGFDFVYLSRKERDEVISFGRNPDRKEKDIDEHGNVTNYVALEDLE
ncbi:hypothetical protein GGS20DRAFT_558766 [Poronia punctata]|nr:hypothetical protein GGS20DRAFT_558766 [Poronia punctata]